MNPLSDRELYAMEADVKAYKGISSDDVLRLVGELREVRGEAEFWKNNDNERSATVRALRQQVVNLNATLETHWRSHGVKDAEAATMRRELREVREALASAPSDNDIEAAAQALNILFGPFPPALSVKDTATCALRAAFNARRLGVQEKENQ